MPKFNSFSITYQNILCLWNIPVSLCCGYLIWSIQSSEWGWCKARKRWSDVYVYRPTVNKWISRCRTHDTCSIVCKRNKIKISRKLVHCGPLLAMVDMRKCDELEWGCGSVGEGYIFSFIYFPFNIFVKTGEFCLFWNRFAIPCKFVSCHVNINVKAICEENFPILNLLVLLEKMNHRHEHIY